MSRYSNNRWNREMEIERERRENRNANNGVNNNTRDYYYRESSRRPDSYSGLIWRIAAGLTIGGVLLFTGIKTVSYFFDPVSRIAAVEDRLMITSKVASGAVREIANVFDERELKMRRERAQIEIDKARDLETIRLARRAEEIAKAKKEAAFKRFYQKPDECDQPERQSIRVECANKYIRARHEFDIAYQE